MKTGGTLAIKKTKDIFKLIMVSVLLFTAWSDIRLLAASHREAPLMTLEPAADITDFYVFRSYEPGREDRVVFIMNVIPMQEPSAGPNYFLFDDTLLYTIYVDTNADGIADNLAFQFHFTTEIREPFDNLSVAYAGVSGVKGLPPPITALDGPGSEGLGLRQSYTVTLAIGSENKPLGSVRGKNLIAVPSNIGPRTMPDYESLAEQGIYELEGGIRVFVGQRDDSFYIDLGAAFDTLNFRRAPVLTDAEDANDNTNPFGVDMLSGFNVSTIAIEVPISLVTGKKGSAIIGAYANTTRLRDDGSLLPLSRMANPLVNELIIGTGFKDRWNQSNPESEADFINFYQFPTLAAILNLAFGVQVPSTPRDDLVSALLQYPTGGKISELLRLNLEVPPTPIDQIKRLGPLAHDAAGNPTPDPAGWPNGRRPNDDVTDIALRVVAGILFPEFNTAPNNRLGDGVNFNIGAPGTNVTPNGIYTKFPFLPTPHSGRDRRHIDPGEKP